MEFSISFTLTEIDALQQAVNRILNDSTAQIGYFDVTLLAMRTAEKKLSSVYDDSVGQ